MPRAPEPNPPDLDGAVQLEGPATRDRARFWLKGILAVTVERELWHWPTPNAPPSRLVEAAGAIIAFEPAPAGDCVALVVSDGRRSTRLALFDPKRGLAVLGDGMPSDAKLAWSPSGRHVAVALGARGIGVASAPLRTLTVLQGAPADADPLSWDDDGLVVEEQHPLGKLRSEFCRLSGGFGAPVHVEPLSCPCWQSPDGEVRVRLNGRALELRDAGGWRLVTEGVDPLGLDVAPWVGSHHWALFGALLDLRTGERRTFCRDGLSFQSATSDGRLALFRDHDQRLVVQTLPADLSSLPAHQPQPAPAPRPPAQPEPVSPAARRATNPVSSPEPMKRPRSTAGFWMLRLEEERTRAHRDWYQRGCQGEGRIALDDENLAQARAQGIFLAAARFTRCDLRDANLALARLNEIELVKCNLTSASLNGAVVAGGKLQGCSLEDADLAVTDFTWARIEGSDFRGAYLDRSKWQGAVVEGCGFRGARFWDARMDGGCFRRCDLSGADLSRQDRTIDRCTTTDAVLEDCDFSEADFTGRRLRGTVFRRCRFHGVRGTAVVEGPCQAIDCTDAPPWLGTP